MLHPSAEPWGRSHSRPGGEGVRPERCHGCDEILAGHPAHHPLLKSLALPMQGYGTMEECQKGNRGTSIIASPPLPGGYPLCLPGQRTGLTAHS